jgi:septal ring factor EnvC (AmiA/AmiB activator)
MPCGYKTILVIKNFVADEVNMENIENLTSLEAAVDKLLNAVGEMKQEKQALKARLDGKEREVERLTRQMQVLQGERTQIEKRVNGLLNSIEKWEELNESAETAESTEAPESATVEKTLF